MSGSGISWTICKSARRSRQTTMPAPHHSVFLQAGCPSCRPTNSVKALKALSYLSDVKINTGQNSGPLCMVPSEIAYWDLCQKPDGPVKYRIPDSPTYAQRCRFTFCSVAYQLVLYLHDRRTSFDAKIKFLSSRCSS